MGQKSHPIILRLHKTNQQSNSCWYNDYNYTTQLLEDCQINQYIQNSCQQMKKPGSLPLIKRDRGGIQIILFSSPSQSTFSPFRTNRPKNIKKAWKAPLLQPFWVPFFIKDLFARLGNKKRNFFVKSGNDLAKNSKNPKIRGEGKNRFFLKNGLMKAKIQSDFHSLVTTRKSLEEGRSLFNQHSISSNDISLFHSLETRGKKNQNTPLKNYVESSLYGQLYSSCQLFLIRCASSFQNPFFLAGQIVYLLQERVSFRRLKERIIKEIKKEIYIKGVRINCSGRVATRSKKAQKARVESIQWGETGLNTFSEQVSFASQKAYTTFGNIGVKVWICYKKRRNTLALSD